MFILFLFLFLLNIQSKTIILSEEFHNPSITAAERVEWGNIGTSTAYGQAVLGGPSICGQGCIMSKQYTIGQKIPNYFKITITLTFFLIGSWDNEQYFLKLDDYIAHENRNNQGNPQTETITKTIDYYAKSFRISVVSGTDEDASNESLGFRALTISIALCNSNCFSCYTSASKCIACVENAALLDDKCVCNEGFYSETQVETECDLQPCMICQMCDPTCKSCDGGTKNSCLSCFLNYELNANGDKSCIEKKQNILIKYGELLKGNTITDAEKSKWIAKNPALIKTCESKEILSAFETGNTLTTSFTFIRFTAHYEIILEFSLYRFGKWDDKIFRILSDDNEIFTHKFVEGRNPLETIDAIIADKYLIKKRFLHNTQSLKLDFASTLTALNVNTGWGIRDFQITIVFCHPTCKKCINYDECLECFYNATLINKKCICDEGYFMNEYIPDKTENQRSICLLCHENCKTCNGGTFDKCLSCYPGNEVVNGKCINLVSNELLTNLDFISDFSKEIQSYWNVPASLVDYTYTCDKILIFGGKKEISPKPEIMKFFDFIKAPPYYHVIFNFTLYIIDDFGINPFVILIDDKFALIQFFSQGPLNKCGDLTQEEQIFPITGSFPHKGLSLKIAFKASDLSTWGFRDFYLKIKKCHNSCNICNGPEPNQCIQCYPFAEKTSGICTCGKGFYYTDANPCFKYPCSVCKFCDSSCKTCEENASKCTSCFGEQILVNNKCLQNFSNATERFLDVFSDYKEEFFDSDRTNLVWKIENVINSKNITLCEDHLKILGGPDKFFGNAKILTEINDLNMNYALQISFRLFKFFSSSQFEEIFLKISSLEEINLKISTEFNTKTTSFCVERSMTQTESKLLIKNVEISVPHQSQSVSISIYSKSDSSSNKESWGIRDFQLLVFKCYPTCTTCFGPLKINCLTCNSSNLLYFNKNECVQKCDSGFFGNNETSICQLCDSTCKECFNDNSSTCLSCNSGKHLLNNTCIFECPQGYFSKFDPEISSSICLPCHNSCLNCSGPQNSQCLNCNISNSLYFSQGYCNNCNELCQVCTSGMNTECSVCTPKNFLLINTCYNICPKNYYGVFREEDDVKICNKCHETCKSCNGSKENNCLSCENEDFLNLNATCLKKCPEGSFAPKGSNVCELCDLSCRECIGKSSNECKTCYSGFNLINNKMCVRSENINITLMDINPDNPLIITLSLDKEWREFSESASNYINISISDVDPDNYTYEAATSTENSFNIDIKFNYLTNITANTMIINISEPKDLELLYPYLIKPINFSIPLNNFVICDEGYYYENETLSCDLKSSSTDPIKVSLQETQIPTQFILLVTNGERKLHRVIAKTADFVVEGVSPDSYTYEINLPNERVGIITIDFNFSKPIIGRPKLKSIIDIPKSFLVNTPNEIIVSKEYASLSDIYELSESEKAAVATAKQVSGVGDTVTASSIMASIMFIPSFGPLKVLMLVNLISFVKYIDVNYPPNIQQLFENKDYSLPLFIFNFGNENGIFVDPKEISNQNYDNDIKYSNDVFKKYGIELYFISNFGDNLLQFFIVLAIAIFCYYFKKRNIINHKYLKLGFDLIHGFLVWGWILSFFISNFKNITFYILRSWTFSKFISPYSKIDLFCSILFFITCFCLLIHVFFVNYNMKKIKKEKIQIKRESKLLAKNQESSPKAKFNIEIEGSPINKDEPNDGRSKKRKKTKTFSIAMKNDEINIKDTIQNNISKKDIISVSLDDVDENMHGSIDKRVKEKQLIASPTLYSKLENSPIMPVTAVISENNEENRKHAKSVHLVIKDKENRETVIDVNADNVQEVANNIFDNLYELENHDEYIKKYGFLTKDYKSDSLVTMNFVLIELTKFFLYSLIIVAIFEIPLLQITLIVAFNSYFVILLITYRPLKSKLKLFFAIVQEIIVTFAMILVAIICFKDLIGDSDPISRVKLGGYFLQANNSLIIVGIIGIAVIGLHKGFKSIVKFIKDQKLKKKQKEEKQKIENQLKKIIKT